MYRILYNACQTPLEVMNKNYFDKIIFISSLQFVLIVIFLYPEVFITSS